MATLAPSLVKFRNELNDIWPQRDHASDGWIGDAAHQDRVSDHNPDGAGTVRAFDTDEDLDGDPADKGRDGWSVAEGLRLSRDARIKYVIYEGRMFSSYPAGGVAPWTWRPYAGENAHRKHVHLSIQPSLAASANTSSWSLLHWAQVVRGTATVEPAKPLVNVRLPALRRGHRGGDVLALQMLLNLKTGANLKLDSVFGQSTAEAVLNVQRFFKLTPDGVANGRVYQALFL